ncbi:MAG: hypothetical protein PF961_22490 [Planctomycetota bacterium]|jgi:hypothetical protein|nr:hypothetical protein [Planctomycetota bacterium]
MLRPLAILLIFGAWLNAAVTIIPIPNGEIQAQAATAPDGTHHLISVRGDPKSCDLFHRTLAPDGTWSAPKQVNSQPGSVIALGTVRGPHLAIDGTGRPHVSWMGSKSALPKAPGNHTPFMYTRLGEDGTFEPQRNLIERAYGVDGGGTVAANAQGTVSVFWHAFGSSSNESDRLVVQRVSTDGGATFSPETPLTEARSGACACCGMHALYLTDGGLLCAWRGATNDGKDRGMWLALSSSGKTPAKASEIAPWTVSTCPMSTTHLAPRPGGAVLCWQTDQTLSLSFITEMKSSRPQPITQGGSPKHPAVAAAADGTLCIAWVEGSGWNRGGKIRYRLFAADGTPLDAAQDAGRCPAWSLPAVIAKADGTFTVIR